VQHVSDLHLKFAIRPHHVLKYDRHPICEAEIRQGKKKKKEETTGQNITVCHRATIINYLFPVVSFLKCMVTEVVSFSIVAYKTPDISQGSVATHLGCGGIFSDSIITNFLLILVVK